MPESSAPCRWVTLVYGRLLIHFKGATLDEARQKAEAFRRTTFQTTLLPFSPKEYPYEAPIDRHP